MTLTTQETNPMHMDDMILISVDDHVVEPPALEGFFRANLPAKFKDRAPKVVRRDDGSDVWLIEGQEVTTFALNACQGRPTANWGVDPRNFDEIRPGCYDVHERIRDMNVNGILASMNFPSWPGLGGQFFVHNDDTEFVAAMTRTYNDWHIHEWCEQYPGRFIPLGISGFSLGPEWMAGEIRRLAELGCHALSCHPECYRFGSPDYHGDEWDVAWQAAEDTASVMVFHFGGFPDFMPRAPFSVIPQSMPFQTAIFAGELLWSRIFRTFPRLRMSLAEGGIGWIPYFLEKADFVYSHHRDWTLEDFGDKMPSDVFREHVQGCFIDDLTGLKNRDAIGIDMIAYESDYPHSDSTWPESPEVLWKSLIAAELSDDEINRVTWQNAAEWYQFDPFQHRSRIACSVAALRAEAMDVDTTPREYAAIDLDHRLGVQARQFVGERRSNTLFIGAE